MNKTEAKSKSSTGRSVLQSIKGKLILIMIAVMAVPLIISIIISYLSQHSEAVENMDTKNDMQVNLVEHDFAEIINENKRVIQAVAESDSVRNLLLKGDDLQDVVDWMTDLDNEIADGNSLIIADATGQQIVRTVGECVNVGDRDYFKQALSTGEFYVSDINTSKSTGQRICTFITPVYDASDTEIIGTVQRNYDLEDFHDMLVSEVTEKNQEILIVDKTGMVVAHSGHEITADNPEDQSMQQFYTDSRSADSGEYDTKWNGIKWRVSYQKEEQSGWVTAVCSDQAVALAEANRVAMIIVVIGIVMLVVAGLIALMFAKSVVAPITEINEALGQLADGRFHVINKFTKRKDELGDMVNNSNNVIDHLKKIIGGIKESSERVGDSSSDLAQTAGQISQTTDSVSGAVQEVAKGATEQADVIQRATQNIGILSDAIQNVAENAETLAGTAAQMQEASQASADALKELDDNFRSMNEAVSDISVTMQTTNEAVNSVNEKVDGITSIASQTNLLALNASIEAARAGDAGKGFAVVAEEIGKLATESAETAESIRIEMENLLRQASDAKRKAGTVTEIGDNVSNVLSETEHQISGLIDNVSSTVDGVNTISGLTQECAAAKGEIVDSMSSLSAISEENAASTEETSASMEELNATVTELSASAEGLSDVADNLKNEIAFFKD